MKDKHYIQVEKQPYVYELNTYNKEDAKSNIDVIEESLNDTKVSLSKYLQDVDTLYDNADEDGYENSLKSFELLQNNLVNELQVNSAKALSNKSNALPLKINRNKDEMVSVEKNTRPRKNYDLGPMSSKLEASNKNKDDFLFENKEENKFVLTIGNAASSHTISIDTLIKVSGTQNFDGYYQCKDVLQKYKNSLADGVYEFYAAGLRNMASEKHMESGASVAIYGSATMEAEIGYDTSSKKSFLRDNLNSTTVTAASSDAESGQTTAITSLKLSVETDGEITITAGAGKIFTNWGADGVTFTADADVVQISGSHVPEYNGYFRVKTVADASLVLYAGSLTEYRANHNPSDMSLADNDHITLNFYDGATLVTSTQSVAYSKFLTKRAYLGAASTAVTPASTGVTSLTFTEENGIITVTAAGGTAFNGLLANEIVKIDGTTEYNGHFMLVEDATATVLKLYGGNDSESRASSGALTATTVSVTPYATADLYGTAAVSESSNLIFLLGAATVTINSADSASAFISFENNKEEEIKLTLGKDLSSPNLSQGSIVKIDGTNSFNGYLAVKSIDVPHSSTTHGEYTLTAPGLIGAPLEKFYSGAKLSVFSSNYEQPDPVFNKMSSTKNFTIKLSNCNKHIAFYVPGLSLYTDDAGLIEVLYAEKENNLDVVQPPADTVTAHRVSGKTALPSNLEELKENYMQIIGTSKDVDGRNPNGEILKLISNLEVMAKSLSSIKNAPYLY